MGGGCIKTSDISWWKSLFIETPKESGITRSDVIKQMKISPTIIKPKTIRHVTKYKYELYDKKNLKTLIDNISFSSNDDSELEVENELITCIAKEYQLKPSSIQPIEVDIIKKFIDNKQKLKTLNDSINNIDIGIDKKTNKERRKLLLIQELKQIKETLNKLPDPIYGKINNNSITLVINKAAISNLLVH